MTQNALIPIAPPDKGNRSKVEDLVTNQLHVHNSCAISNIGVDSLSVALPDTYPGARGLLENLDATGMFVVAMGYKDPVRSRASQREEQAPPAAGEQVE